MDDSLVEVFDTMDMGEHMFISSLLKSHGILPMEPNFNTERMSMLTSGIARRFTTYVHPKDIREAKSLISEHLHKSDHEMLNPETYANRQWMLAAGVVLAFLSALLLAYITNR